jgi:hypothetical protein
MPCMVQRAPSRRRTKNKLSTGVQGRQRIRSKIPRCRSVPLDRALFVGEGPSTMAPPKLRRRNDGTKAPKSLRSQDERDLRRARYLLRTHHVLAMSGRVRLHQRWTATSDARVPTRIASCG